MNSSETDAIHEFISRSDEKDYRIKESTFSPISNASNSTSKFKDSHIFMNICDRTRNHDNSAKSKKLIDNQSDNVFSSMNSEEINRHKSCRQSRDSDRTTHKEIYIKRDNDEYPNIDEINNTIFSPVAKESTVKNQYRRNRSERMRNNDENSDAAKEEHSDKAYSQNYENDSSSSPEPLSSKLDKEQMAKYDIECMQELDIEQVKQSNNQRKRYSNNEYTTLAVKSQILYDEFDQSNNISHNCIPINQVSGDKQTPSEAQTNEEIELQQEEFRVYDEESKSIIEFDCAKDPKRTSQSASENKKPNEAFELKSFQIINKEPEVEKYLNPTPEEHNQLVAYLAQSHYLSGITEKSDEESGETNRLNQNSCYIKDRDNVSSTILKHEQFLSSNSSAKSSRINSRLLRYFEDSLQKEIPISLSPSIAPNDRSNEGNFISNHAKREISNQYVQIHQEENRLKDDTNSLSCSRNENEKDKDFKKLRSSEDNFSNYSLSKSNNYDDLRSNNTSSKKRQHKYFTHRHNTESDESNAGTPRITYDQLECKEESLNSSMTRKKKYIEKFIESAKEDNILNTFEDNEQNLNISSISRLEESTPSKQNHISEDEKTEKDENNEKERKISRQPTFSSFTPQSRDEKENVKATQNSFKDRVKNKSEGRGDRNLSFPEGNLKPLLLSLTNTFTNQNAGSPVNANSGYAFQQDLLNRSSDEAHPQFFLSSDTKNFMVSSDGSRKYRSPTFEAISEENNGSNIIVDSPTNKRLLMDIDFPEKCAMKRASRRPPSIHAALSPELSAKEKEMMIQNPKIIIAHYEGIIGNLNSDNEHLNNKNEELDKQILKLKYQLSDSNKLLLKLQEEKESDKLKFLEIINKLNQNSKSKTYTDSTSLKKYFTLEMSSNRTSEDDLHKNSSNKIMPNYTTERTEAAEPLSTSIYYNDSKVNEHRLDEFKVRVFKLEASLKQREEQIFTLKSLNQNLQTELKTYKDFEAQNKTEIIQHKTKRKECEEQLKKLRVEKGQDKIALRKLNNDNEELQTEIDEMKENCNFIQNELEEIKHENEQLKIHSSKIEKDKAALQCNIDKLNRMFTKATADTKRYKSVVDLQKSALNDLQKDYNRMIIDFSQTGGLNNDGIFTKYADKNLNGFKERFEFKESLHTLQDHRTNNSSPYINDFSHFNSICDYQNINDIQRVTSTRNASERENSNVERSTLFNDYSSSRDPRKMFQNLTNQFSDCNRENRSHMISRDNTQIERTFNEDSYCKENDNSKLITLTENHSQRNKNMISTIVPKMKQHPMFTGLEKKRMSTEQLIEVSPGSCSPDNITDKSDSFKSSSTILHSPGIYKVSEQRTTEKNNSSSKKDFDCHDVDIQSNFCRNSYMKRTQSRRESRILIQPLPRLFTKSKYDGFRQAKSSERKECNTSRNKLMVSQSQYPSPKDNISDCINKDSVTSNDIPVSFTSNVRSPKPTATAKTSNCYQPELINSNEKTASKSRSKLISKKFDYPCQSKTVCDTKIESKWTKSRESTVKPNFNDDKSNLKTLTQHLNVICERKTQIQNEIVIIERMLSHLNKRRATVKSAKKENSYNSGYKMLKSDSSKFLQTAEVLMNKKRKAELEKELDSINKSICNVNARIKNIAVL